MGAACDVSPLEGVVGGEGVGEGDCGENMSTGEEV